MPRYNHNSALILTTVAHQLLIPNNICHRFYDDLFLNLSGLYTASIIHFQSLYSNKTKLSLKTHFETCTNMKDQNYVGVHLDPESPAHMLVKGPDEG